MPPFFQTGVMTKLHNLSINGGWDYVNRHCMSRGCAQGCGTVDKPVEIVQNFAWKNLGRERCCCARLPWTSPRSRRRIASPAWSRTCKRESGRTGTVCGITSCTPWPARPPLRRAGTRIPWSGANQHPISRKELSPAMQTHHTQQW